MRVILLTSDYNISANLAIRALLDNPALKKNDIKVAGILLADQFNFKSANLLKTLKYFAKMSSWFLIKQIITNVWKQIMMAMARSFIPGRKREYFSIEEMADMHNIPFKEVGSINSEKAKEFIKAKNPDMLVSCFLLEIVKPEILALPKKASINVHPALIQKHRGIFTSFWAIMKNWNKSGATIHYMTKYVDKGPIILQKHFFVYPSDTIHAINRKSAVLGGRLLVKALVKIKKNKVRAIKFKKIGKMYSLPTPADIKLFYARGRSQISRREFFRL